MADIALTEPSAWSVSDVGRRSNQEDWHSVWRDDTTGALLAIVADGMGGHAAGEIASATAGEAFLAHFAAAREQELAQRLLQAAQAANAAIADRIDAAPALEGMGTTLLAVFLEGRALSWLSIGDSCLFLVSGGRIVRLNADHSYGAILNRMVASGEMSREEADGHPDRNALIHCLMGEEVEEVEVTQRPVRLSAGDVLIVASDGIETLAPEAIAEAVQRGSHSAEPVATEILSAVQGRQRPSQDNVTIVAICMSMN